MLTTCPTTWLPKPQRSFIEAAHLDMRFGVFLDAPDFLQ
jgi:hypothetical protein